MSIKKVDRFTRAAKYGDVLLPPRAIQLIGEATTKQVIQPSHHSLYIAPQQTSHFPAQQVRRGTAAAIEASKKQSPVSPRVSGPMNAIIRRIKAAEIKFQDDLDLPEPWKSFESEEEKLAFYQAKCVFVTKQFNALAYQHPAPRDDACYRTIAAKDSISSVEKERLSVEMAIKHQKIRMLVELFIHLEGKIKGDRPILSGKHILKLLTHAKQQPKNVANFVIRTITHAPSLVVLMSQEKQHEIDITDPAKLGQYLQGLNDEQAEYALEIWENAVVQQTLTYSSETLAVKLETLQKVEAARYYQAAIKPLITNPDIAESRLAGVSELSSNGADRSYLDGRDY